MKRSHLISLFMLSLSACSLSAAELTAQQKEQILHGAYLARAGDCVACHSTEGNPAFTGGLPMESPIGTMYSTNITPDPKTGIGDYTLEDFDNAVRKGKAKDGHPLYPAMPYTSFAKMTDDDLRDLYLYFMHGVEPVEKANHDTDIPWPLSMRWPLSVWDMIYFEDAVYKPEPTKSPEWNRGAYLVQGLGHCGSCHTPRGIAIQEKALDQTSKDYLSGGTLEGWHAPNLNGDKPNGLGHWTEQDIVDFLQKGHNETSAAFGSMADVVINSTQYLSDSDLKSIAVYLKSLPPVKDEPAPIPTDRPETVLYEGMAQLPGALLYLDNCATCHRTDGKGYKNTFPALDGNSSLNSEDPSSVIQLILIGGQVPSTAKSPTGLTMPDFGWRLNDFEIAALTSFIRNSWSNQAPNVTEKQVKEIRELVEKSDKK